MKKDEKNSLDDDKSYRLWTLMLQASHLMSRRRENELRPYGLRRMEAAIIQVLLLLKETPTISEISRQIVREPHTVGTLIYRMKKKGLLKITQDSKRKNIKRINLTDKGKTLAKQTIKIRSIKEIMTCLSEEDQTKLRSYLRTIRKKVLEDMGMSHRFPKSYQPS